MGTTISRTILVLAVLGVLAGCGSATTKSQPPLTVGDVQSAFGSQGIHLTPFSGQLVSSSPPTVDVEILKSDAEAAASSTPQQVDGVLVDPTATRNVLVWVDSTAPAAFRGRVSAALAALRDR